MPERWERRRSGAPEVSVLIVTWNRRDDVLETIRAVYDQPYQDLEVIVVDNGSSDGTVAAVGQAYPGVKLVALGENRGICGGRNAGIACAQGRIIFCLDSDASPGKDTLANVVGRFGRESDLGVINSRIVDARSHKMEGGPGWVYSDKQLARQHEEFLSWSFSEGGAAIRKEVLDRVGPFWEQLFFGREGEELSLRVWDAGYKVLYYPESIVYHRTSAQQRLDGSERLYFDVRNSFYIYLVRYPWWMLGFYAPLKLVASLLKGIRRRCLRTILRAYVDVLRQSPTLWGQRRPISTRTAAFHLRLQREQGPLSWDPRHWLRRKA